MTTSFASSGICHNHPGSSVTYHNGSCPVCSAQEHIKALAAMVAAANQETESLRRALGFK